MSEYIQPSNSTIPSTINTYLLSSDNSINNHTFPDNTVLSNNSLINNDIETAESSININTSNINIDELLNVFTQIQHTYTTELQQQFLESPTKISKRSISKLLTPEQCADMYRTLSTGIIDIKKLSLCRSNIETLPSEPSIPITNDKQHKKQHKKHTVKLGSKELAIIEQQSMKRHAIQITNIINIMKSHKKDLLDNPNITIDFLKGILSQYNYKQSNKIMRIIILGILIEHYTNHKNINILGLIFEFMMLMNDFKSEWQPSNVSHVSVDISKMNNREKRQLQNKKNCTSEFILPTEDEIVNPILSEQLKNSIISYVHKANEILQQNNIDTIKYQMVDSFYRLRPLCSWDDKKLQLDEWQLSVLQLIDNKQSIVVMAPTSSGKTICAQYCAMSNTTDISSLKVLFIVPSNVLANQIAGTLVMSGISTTLLTDDESYNVSESVNVIVSTPSVAEEFLCNSGIRLKYAVFDEIQQINDDAAIERLIKIVNCPFLILSATIPEPIKFVQFLETISNNKVHFISYNKRFIVQQKHIWNGDSLLTLHPLACVDTTYIKECKFKTGDLAMTSRDLYIMGTDLSVHFSEYNLTNKLHPNLFFDNTVSIDMDQISKYDEHLKQFIIQMTIIDEPNVIAFLNLYKLDSDSEWSNKQIDFITSIIDMLNVLKNKSLLPALVFLLNDVAVLNIFKNIIVKLELMESHYLDWYKPLMLTIHSKINDFTIDEPRLRESVSKKVVGKGSKINEINDQMNQLKQQFLHDLLEYINIKYTNESVKINNNPNYTVREKEMLLSFIQSDFSSKVNVYYNSQSSTKDVKLPVFNQYGPSSLFSFHQEPLSIYTMQTIKNDLKRFLSQVVDHTISNDINYNNIFIRGIERGIILYSKILPTPFQRIVQQLIIEHHAPVCICDDSLAYGVNFPTRSVVIIGNHITENISVLKAQQISGRSGRRGFDTQGHVIYCRVNYKHIMRGTFDPLIGKNTLTPYSLLPCKIYENITSDYIIRVIEIPLNHFMQQNSPEIYDKSKILVAFNQLYSSDELLQQNSVMSLLLWLFRDEVYVAPNIFILINEILNIAKQYEKAIHAKIKSIADTKSSNSSKRSLAETDSTLPAKTQSILPISAINNVIELLFRILDRDETEFNDSTDIPADITSDMSAVNTTLLSNIMCSNKWVVRPNMNNTHIINCIIHNNISDKSDTYEHTANLAFKLNKVTSFTLKIYNLFAELGNSNIIHVLDDPLNVMIKCLNNIRSLN